MTIDSAVMTDDEWETSAHSGDAADAPTERLPLDVIRDDERNPKAHDQAAIVRSILRFGFTEPVLLDTRTGKLLAGHGRTAALRRLETDGAPDDYEGPWPPRGILVDGTTGRWLLPVRPWRTKDDAEAGAYLIASNRTSELGGWENGSLARLLEDVANYDPSLLDVSGYSADDLGDLLAELEEQNPAPLDYPGGELADNPDGVPGENSTDGNSRRTPGLADLKDEYASSDTRMVVLVYEGPRYVWAVRTLTALAKEMGVDSNSDVVLQLLENASGEQAPAVPAAGEPEPDPGTGGTDG